MYDRSSPFLASPVPPGSKVDFAGQRLRDAVLWCELEPGEKVSEGAVCARFGLARAATRTALARLAGEGLVEALPRKGWRIRPVTAALIGDLVAARRLAEPTLARVALGDADRRRLDELAAVIAALAGRTDATSLTAARQYERELLDRLAARGNLWIAGWLRQAWDHGARVVHFLERHAGSRPGGRLPVADRGALVAALARGDRAAAEAALEAAIAAYEAFVTARVLALPAELAVGRPPAGAPTTTSPRTAAGRPGRSGGAPSPEQRRAKP